MLEGLCERVGEAVCVGGVAVIEILVTAACVEEGLIVGDGTGEGKTVARPPHAVIKASRRIV